MPYITNSIYSISYYIQKLLNSLIHLPGLDPNNQPLFDLSLFLLIPYYNINFL